jgi:regulator of protease activity HflC (stomatin/prohibitin superfamily)
MPSTSFLPKPDDSWPTWGIWLYWIIVAVAVAFIAIKTVIKSCHKVPQMHWGIRERLNQPIRKHPLRKGEACDTCDTRRASDCPLCQQGAYCYECTYCPTHDQLDLRLPGFKLQLPFTHGYQDSDRRAQPFSLTAFAYINGQGPKVILDGYGHYAVGNDSRAVYAANYAAAELETSVVQAAELALRQAVDRCGMGATTDEISQKALELFDGTRAYNVQLTSFTAKPIVPAPEQVLATALTSGDLASRLTTESVSSQSAVTYVQFGGASAPD